MKIILMVLVVLFYHRRNVCSAITPLHFLADKFHEFASNVAETLRSVKQTIRSILYMHIRKSLQHHSYRKENPQKEEYTKAFSNFAKISPRVVITEKYVKWNLTTVPAQVLRSQVTSIVNKTTTTEETSTMQMSTVQMGTLNGNNIESHVVNTKDGYILTLHRMILQNATELTNKTVLLHHGLLGSSTDWLLLDANTSLPYLLSNAGYDVWMANARGNYYSRNHHTMKIDSADFWNFSFQEMGEYDLPAVIDYIRKVKQNNESINFIGHSMGATALLVLLSTVPIYNSYIRIGILLAPLAFMSNIKGPLKVLSNVALTPSQPLFDILGLHGELFPSREVPEMLVNKYCEGPKLYCKNPLLFVSGGIAKMQSYSEDFMTKFIHHVPSGGSTKTILHYAQLAKTGKFHKYMDMLSEYKLQDITLPIAIFSSTEDWLAPIPDVVKLYANIASPLNYNIIGKNFSHTEFVWGLQAATSVYSKLIELLENGLKFNAIKTNEI